jgi:hypothetical protein
MEDLSSENKKFCECGCGQKVKSRFVSGHNTRLRIGEKHPRWKGGRTIDKRGYVKIRKNGKRVKEHRLIYEEYHKCCLLSWTIIHHTNGNTQDNRIENLEPMRQAQHIPLHHTKDMSDRFCYICKSKTTYVHKNGTPNWNISEFGYYCMKCYLKQYNRKHSSNFMLSQERVKIDFYF